ncbi:MAG: class I SAM-dependent methyltransferase, partial [Pseudomonadota bacterium]
LRWQGTRPPSVDGSVRMLDIGCGDGIAIALTAASCPDGQFCGIDGMPEHVARGTAFAASHEIDNLELRCLTFEDALEAADGLYDYIISQGVIAWVSAENRARVLDLAASKLAPGGVFAVGYNAMPGWQDRLTMQRLLRELADGTEGAPSQRFHRSLEMLEAIEAAGAYALPKNRLEELHDLQERLPADYFPHEYLNENWAPLWSSDVRNEMMSRGLTFCGQTNFGRLREDFCLKAAHRTALENINNPLLRDSLIDLFCNTGFRVDMFVREPAGGLKEDLIEEAWLSALCSVEEARFECRTAAGRLKFDNPAARHLLHALHGGPRRFGDILAEATISTPDLVNAADALLTGRHIQPASPPRDVPSADDLNMAILYSAATGEGVQVEALVGSHGVVTCRLNELLVAGMGNEALIDRARTDPAFRERMFDTDAGLDDPETSAAIDRGRDAIKSRLARMGVRLPAALT